MTLPEVQQAGQLLQCPLFGSLQKNTKDKRRKRLKTSRMLRQGATTKLGKKTAEGTHLLGVVSPHLPIGKKFLRFCLV